MKWSKHTGKKEARSFSYLFSFQSFILRIAFSRSLSLLPCVIHKNGLNWATVLCATDYWLLGFWPKLRKERCRLSNILKSYSKIMKFYYVHITYSRQWIGVLVESEVSQHTRDTRQHCTCNLTVPSIFPLCKHFQHFSMLWF